MTEDVRATPGELEAKPIERLAIWTISLGLASSVFALYPMLWLWMVFYVPIPESMSSLFGLSCPLSFLLAAFTSVAALLMGLLAGTRIAWAKGAKFGEGYVLTGIMSALVAIVLGWAVLSTMCQTD